MDYCGIGEFVLVSLKGFVMFYLDWVYWDFVVVVELFGWEEWLLYWIGYFFGGYVIGLLFDYGWFVVCYSFGSGVGWSGWMLCCEVFKVCLLWFLVLLLLVVWKGYMVWSLLGMGDDLLLGVYCDWKCWCCYFCYYFDDLVMCYFY